MGQFGSIEMERYLLAHSEPEDELLHELDRQTHLRTIQPRMVSGHLQGSLLKMLVHMAKPHTLLEVGTFTGYSALCMAAALPDSDARLHTVEINDELEPLIRSFFNRSPRRNQIVLHICQLDEALAKIPGEIDFVFIDADKREYIDYYEAILPRVRKGGYILADNVLWDGHVLETPKPSDHHTQAVKAFNDHVAADSRVEKVIVPIRDGLTIMMKR